MPVDEAAVPRQLEELRRQIRELGPSVAKSFKSTVAKLQAQADDIAEQTAYLAGLTTVSSAGATLNTGPVAGDQSFRWFDSSPALTLQAQCPTGRLLITVGTGQCTLAPGDSSAVGLISFQASAPSGWTQALDVVDSRVYSTNNTSLGVPLVVNAPLSGVPKTETITITVKYGIWSSSTTTLASANFESNYVIAQVLAN